MNTRKNYMQPVSDAVLLTPYHGVCQLVSKNAPFTNGGGTDTIDPQQGM